ncbi:hypothetical protein SPRG_20569 [Saprolegnia parasitica CBS 223.65]|uniref:Sodium/calcium exchanger membrane region domain-containing protein n=1 Tax=Saprolegnia parasitica (strain CBS 223.65) TaxID=695850 RepID=A0A067CIZ6_SAPPC|nr:hypothetical protein SPRG_20569 [Saprolegnia parasitica CBS 223.65]KDO26767.1 hypothetical protein SPRG_20569 [Saprolegnia parasitica CBS 223.65]|eukprot:XP_012202521.1 hypothetical protein SPRG_20569 [Saprolegnia parasitica CBS 223.65]
MAATTWRVLLLAPAVVSGLFVFPDNCGRPGFIAVPDELRCACAHATRVSTIDYLSLHYCDMDALPLISVTLLSTLLCLLFYSVGDTTDRYMVPAVTSIAAMTRLDPSVAGATLLAFANGAPDLFSCVASFSGAHTHSGFGVGGLIGSGLVVAVFTLGHLAYLADGFDLRKSPFMRDVAFYLVTVLGLLLAYRVGYISVPMAIAAIGWYAVYTVSVVRMPSMPPPAIEDDDDDDKAHVVLPATTATEDIAVSMDPKEEDDEDDECASTTDTLMSVDESPRSFWCDVTDWDKVGRLHKVVLVLLAPFLLARHVTVPRLESPVVSRKELTTVAFALPSFLLAVSTRFVHVPLTAFGAALVVSTVLAGLTYHWCDGARRSWQLLRSFLALFLSSLWVFVIGHEIVAVMYVLGVGVGISSGTLGILVLAWGNSIGDFVGNRALVRQGHVHMATAACIAGPIFNTLVGGGLSLLLGCLYATNHRVAIWSADHNGSLGIGFVVLAIALLSLLVLGSRYPAKDIELTPTFGLFLVALYSLFCVWTLVDETSSRQNND